MEPNQISGKSLALWGGAALLISLIAIGAAKLAGPAEEIAGTITLEPITEADWVKGTVGAPIELIEYSDFECPACAAYFPLIEEVLAKYEGRIALVYRHFPLSQHRQARAAAYASEAAGKQGKFWEMYALIFQKQTEWAGKTEAKDTFETYATELGLNVEQFRVDVDSREVRDRVDDDYRNGLAAKVNATPTFFLNGTKIQNPQSLEAFMLLIDASFATST